MSALPADVMEGLMRVHQANVDEGHYTPRTNGSYPGCMNAIWTMVCERCGGDVGDAYRGPCPAVAPDQRWGTPFTGVVKTTMLNPRETVIRINTQRRLKGQIDLPVPKMDRVALPVE